MLLRTALLTPLLTACAPLVDDDYGLDDTDLDGGEVPTGGDCVASTDCGPRDICRDDVCQAALERTWDVTVVAASAEQTDADGDFWDEGGGAPDLFVDYGVPLRTGISWDQRCSTPPVTDSYQATWDVGCELLLSPDPTLVFEVKDQDPALPSDALLVRLEGAAEVMASLKDWEQDVVYGDEAVRITVRYTPVW